MQEIYAQSSKPDTVFSSIEIYRRIFSCIPVEDSDISLGKTLGLSARSGKDFCQDAFGQQWEDAPEAGFLTDQVNAFEKLVEENGEETFPEKKKNSHQKRQEINHCQMKST